ncbi:nitroreductase family protein [Chloroflexota bacterium]
MSIETVNGIQTRKSFRSLKSTPIHAEMMRRIMEAAGRSPSYTNTQPWEVAVVSGKKKDELSPDS